MNKSFRLLIAFIFILPVGMYAQIPTPPKDSLRSLNAGDLEDEFATSLEMSKKVIIVDQKEILVPKEYARKEKRFFYEQVPVMANDNFAIVDLPKGYTGFRVELIKVHDEPLPDDDIIFFRHGNVVEETIGEKEYAYSIGDFLTEAEANEFMETFLLELYPAARVIPYKDGMRN